MPLKSYQFAGNERFERCLTQDAAHVVPGESGPHVHDIQVAIEIIEGVNVDVAEKQASFYGPSTAAAVLRYKTQRNIINRSYQSSVDDIVGRMTIARLDEDMFNLQTTPRLSASGNCPRGEFPLVVRAAPSVSFHRGTQLAPSVLGLLKS